ncbi:MAG TPA: DUF1634 domain-containing protein [Gemmatimonadales bacterium]|jgi:uncharacterized membrane protein|nr:DUF1634 domain-containing protein [Gemmatimonadales bacterium]
MTDRAAEEHRVELMVGTLLRWGVLLAAAVTALGGALLLLKQGSVRMDFHRFAGEPGALASLTGIARGALALDPAAVVQLGVVLLIATPIARVMLTLGAFLHERDRLYTVITALVLGILLYGLLGGGHA